MITTTIIIICLWLIFSLALGILFTFDNLQFKFFNELKWKTRKMNIFGKSIVYLFFVPYIFLYVIIYSLMKIMTWHPNSKN